MKPLNYLVLYNQIGPPCSPLAMAISSCPQVTFPRASEFQGGSSYLGVSDGKAIYVN